MIIEEVPLKTNGEAKLTYKILCKCEDCGVEFRRVYHVAKDNSRHCKSCATIFANSNRSPELKAKMIEAAAKHFRGKTWEEIHGEVTAAAQRTAMSEKMSGTNNPNSGGVYSRGFADRPLTGTWESQFGIEEAARRKEAHSLRLRGTGNPMYGRPSPTRAGNGISGWFEDRLYFRSLLELAFILKCSRENLQIESAECSQYRVPYTLDGSERTYTPDFIDENGVLYEIKPSSLATSREVTAKLKAHPNVKLVTEKTLTRPEIEELMAMIESKRVVIDPSKMDRVLKFKEEKLNVAA